jgi:glycosyltransferase involved in cell wall biosynthesis
VIPVAHDSGGPALDIVIRYQGQPTGYRAVTADQYASAMLEVLASPVRGSADMQDMRVAARNYVAASFSDEVFDAQLHKLLRPFVQQCEADFGSSKGIKAIKQTSGERKKSR